MKFGINAGHTLKGPGSGAVGILNESNETRAVVTELNALLKAGGHTVVNCNIDSASTQNSYLAKVVELANRQDLDYFISIHFNSTKGAKGTEVYTYEGRQFTDALEVCKNISALGFVNRGVKAGTGLYVIRKTKAKSMLIEVCFVDDPDASKYKGLGARKIAEAIYKAIVDTNVPNISGSQPQQPVPSAGTKYSVGQKVRFSTCYKSSTAPNSEAILSSKMSKDNGTITKIVSGAKNPYLLDNGLCWVNDGDIREILNSSNSQTKPVGSGDKITVDGIWGKNTTLKAQKVFGTTADGIVSNQHDDYKSKNPGLLSTTFEWEAKPGSNGSLLIKKIQSWCGVSADGFIGPNTIKAMQRKLGTTADGVVSKPSAMVKAFQNWLNAQ